MVRLLSVSTHQVTKLCVPRGRSILPWKWYLWDGAWAGPGGTEALQEQVAQTPRRLAQVGQSPSSSWHLGRAWGEYDLTC